MKNIFAILLRTQYRPLGRIKIGRFTYGDPYIFSRAKSDTVRIGDFCSIGPNVMIIPTRDHIPPSEYKQYMVSSFHLAHIKKGLWQESYNFTKQQGTIIIGNDVWIGAGAIILSGVAIGDGAIIGAGAVVTHDIPPYSVVGGVPAKILRYRYTTEQIGKLLEIAWWKWPLDKILDNMPFFYGRVDDFIAKFWSFELGK